MPVESFKLPFDRAVAQIQRYTDTEKSFKKSFRAVDRILVPVDRSESKKSILERNFDN